MKTFLSYFLGLFAILLALLIIPVDRMFDEVMNTNKMVTGLKRAELYSHLLQLSSQKIMEQEQIKKAKESPLITNNDDIQNSIQNTFTEDWFYNNMVSMHGEMIRLISEPEPAQDYYIGIDLRDRKNLLSENLTSLVTDKLKDLPACAPQDLLTMNTVFKENPKNVGSFFTSLDIRCKPPEPVQKQIRRSVRMEFDKLIKVLPDSLNLFVFSKNQPKNESGLQNLRSVYAFSQSFALVGYSLLFLLLLCVAFINIKELQLLFFRIGLPLIVLGTVMSIPFVYLVAKSNEIFIRPAMHFTLAQSSGDPVSDEAAKLLISYIKGVAEHYSWNMIYLCATVLVAGIALIGISRYLNLRPLSPLDSHHEANI